MSKRPAESCRWFTPQEVALAAGADLRTVRALLGPDANRWDCLIPRPAAVALVRRLRAAAGPGAAGDAGTGTRATSLFEPRTGAARPRGGPFAASTTAHAIVLAGVVLISAAGADSVPRTSVGPLDPVRLVYLAQPGPGGGGGGGGARQPAPPPKARRQGPSPVSSPVQVRERSPVEPRPEPPEAPKPTPPEEQPPVAAPLAEVPGDESTRTGLPVDATGTADSRGSGSGTGTGSGTGAGLGEGDGPGLGPGTGGGTGGGPYRPGSGVEPPVVLREVRPTYTEVARQRGITGEVLLEIVVLQNGSVGNVRVLRGLGSGLDERAVEAVRQWEFDPARMRGTPVDVMVEVAVEFRLR